MREQASLLGSVNQKCFLEGRGGGGGWGGTGDPGVDG